MHVVQKTLKQQFSKLKGFVSTLLQEKSTGISKPMKNQLQILHNHDHWIGASTVHCKDS